HSGRAQALAEPQRIALHYGELYTAGDITAGAALQRAQQLWHLAQPGQILLGHGAAERLRRALPQHAHLRDLGAHRLPDLLRSEAIYQLVTDSDQLWPAIITPLDTAPHNLPAQPTALIGREQELRALCDLMLRSEVQLLTLTGSGGIGKTRLALQAAGALLEAFPDGCFFVSLDHLADPALVMHAIAQALAIHAPSNTQLFAQVVREIHAKRLLLVLDNLEHVLDAAHLVDRLTAAAPGLKVLATSREPLHLYGEREYAVPPLSLPAAQQAVGGSDLLQSEAVVLFLERARAASHDFVITASQAPAVVALCQRLGGVPLAIELAAARAKALSPAALLHRLNEGIDVLSGHVRNRPARQQSLQHLFDWSYDLLNSEEQRLFARLGVVAGGFTLEIAAALNANESSPLSQPALLSTLLALVDKSLLWQESRAGEPTFRMLETTRIYARGLAPQEQAAALLLEEPPAEVRATGPARPADLSEREVEVLRLIAGGLTDAQVAAHLVISPRTVNSHLRTIYSKINVTSRTAAARFAFEHGLA
ncbi:MAG: LuxR family transcriptional regulator, partial [Chloroflexales bacterium]|nr:LuxR family transcriptional regulator [Chloroflexales bacterium]